MIPDGACVAAGHPATASAAAEMLAAGGNAFDACVAAGFAAAVAEPGFTGLAGGGFLLAHTAAGDDVLYDFFVDTPGLGLTSLPEPDMTCVTVHFPGSDQDFHVGAGSVAVPGCLAGYVHVLRSLGRLDLATVVAPAHRLAADGVVLSDLQGSFFALLEPILTYTPDTAAVFAPTGRLLGPGARYVNADLAGFLERVDDRGFAAPDTASALVDALGGAGGLVTRADLDAYRVIEREPLAVSYRDATVLTNPPPSFGGELVGLGLQLLDEGGAPELWGSAAWAERLAAVMVEVDDCRAAGEVRGRLRVSRGTTHVSVADAEGNVASMTTSNGEGAGVLAPGTGVLLNNMLGEDDLHPGGFHAAPPGERVASMMAPSIVLGRDGRPVLAAGSGGSKRIRTAVLQVVADAVDEPEVSLSRVVDRPRLHWDGAVLQVEPGLAPDTVAALAQRWPVNEWSQRNVYFGGVHAVRPGRDAAGDPRRGGASLVGPGGEDAWDG